MAAGRLLFYTPDKLPSALQSLVHPIAFVKALGPQLVARLTDGPYCHVAIDIGDFTLIEAVGNGISHNRYYAPAAVANVQDNVEADELARGLAYLKSRVGERYAYEDTLFNAVLGLLRISFKVGTPGSNCSALAMDYLSVLGLVPPGDYEGKSPNDIARLVGVVPA